MTARSPLVFSPGAAGPVLRLVPATDPHTVTWRDFALCAEADPDAFFPEKGGSTRNARRVCAACPVAPQCLEFALAHMHHRHDAGMFGIWAGTSVDERKLMLEEAA